MTEDKKSILRSLENTLKQTDNWETLERLEYFPGDEEVIVRFGSGAVYTVKSDCLGIELINRVIHVGEAKKEI